MHIESEFGIGPLFYIAGYKNWHSCENVDIISLMLCIIIQSTNTAPFGQRSSSLIWGRDPGRDLRRDVGPALRPCCRADHVLPKWPHV